VIAEQTDGSSTFGWDPNTTRQLIGAAAPIARRWFRPEVGGLQSFPSVGGTLIVSNHSGGLFTPDVLILAAAFYRQFGYERPLYTLGHDALFSGPLGGWVRKLGLIPASAANAGKALQSGGVVLVFPGGIFDAYRPTINANVIDFKGRTGYVKLAIDADVPLVPSVSIGGQESQLFLTRGTWLAKRLGLGRLRSDILPLTLGFPFGLSVVVPPNLPLPTRIVAHMTEPIDIRSQFGEHPDIGEVDAHVRSVMQVALDQLARQRRFPILG